MTEAVIINFNESVSVTISTTEDTIVLPQIEAGDGTISVIAEYSSSGSFDIFTLPLAPAN